jgi:hypothetical protein
MLNDTVPIMLLCGKLVPALMIGNCIIIKPSPFTPYCGKKIFELAQRFFLPTYRSRFQPYGMCFSTVGSIILLFINGFTVFFPSE